jgi:hypothetical protein
MPIVFFSHTIGIQCQQRIELGVGCNLNGHQAMGGKTAAAE